MGVTDVMWTSAGIVIALIGVSLAVREPFIDDPDGCWVAIVGYALIFVGMCISLAVAT